MNLFLHHFANTKNVANRPMLLGLAFTACVLLVGCGKKTTGLVHVSGQVRLDGIPLNGGVICVLPANGRPSGGTIDQNGHFTLTCRKDSDGCLPGTHPVEVRPVSLPPEAHRLPAHSTTSENGVSPSRIPPKYHNAETSHLTVTIDGPTDSLIVDLTTKSPH